LAVIIVLVLIIVLPVYFLVVRPQNQSAAVVSGNNPGQPAPPANPSSVPNIPTGLITGGDGSTVTQDDGTTFTYSNKFGGYWYYDPSDPYNESARPQQDIPPLNQTWRWGVDIIQGVNLGGWLVLEPFITPALFQKYPGAVDEYTLSKLMRADVAGGGINQIEDHYKTFITEQDFADIAAAGLNWVRLPVPYWAIETWDGEPYLAGVAWKYALKAFGWARKYGIRINLDFHAVPGSQNAWNHSGRGDNPNFLIGPMGYANGQRTLDYIRILTEFISQDEYKNLIPMFGVLNEGTPPEAEMKRFYYQAYETVRAVTGVGAGKGPFVSIHDGFSALTTWAGFLAGADRLALEGHLYFAFGGTDAPIATYVQQPCDNWASNTNTSFTSFGVYTAGEWSLAHNNCGLFVNGVTNDPTPTNCVQWENWETWTDDTKQSLRAFALTQMSALQNSFFWTYKVDPDQTGHVRAPQWSYKLGLANGWIAANPREAIGACPSTTPFSATSFQPWQLGGAGAGTITASVDAYTLWPPAGSAFLYSPNRPIPKLADTPLPAAAVNVKAADGWANDSDVTLSMGPNPGCTYPSAWDEGGGPSVAACTVTTAT